MWSSRFMIAALMICAMHSQAVLSNENLTSASDRLVVYIEAVLQKKSAILVCNWDQIYLNVSFAQHDASQNTFHTDISTAFTIIAVIVFL